MKLHDLENGKQTILDAINNIERVNRRLKAALSDYRGHSNDVNAQRELLFAWCNYVELARSTRTDQLTEYARLLLEKE